MVSWNPEQYLTFGNERLQPALDLLMHISLKKPKLIYDLGCGPGTVTTIIKDKWSQAKIIGVDSSKEMLDRARKLNSDINWVEDDITSWKPDQISDLIFSNATLHWLDNHETLLPTLMDYLQTKGILAIQMPNNFTEPSHQSIYQTVKNGSWYEKLMPLLREKPVLDVADYYKILTPLSSTLIMWQTTYFHVLEGQDPVVEWTKGSVLKPFLDQLSETEKEIFLEAYTNLIRKAYPVLPDKKTIMPFNRIFIVAVKN